MTGGTRLTMLTVGQVAEQLDVTVRTLHHDDETTRRALSSTSPASGATEVSSRHPFAGCRLLS